MTKLSMLIFQSPSIKPSLEIRLVIPKDGKVTLRGTGLAVPNAPNATMDRNSTYAVLSRNEQCRELRAHEGGGSQKVTSDDEGGQDTP